MSWDPEQYLRFGDQRLRPGLDLIARIPEIAPHFVVDLGSGTGALTSVIADRWPAASITGIDTSSSMIAEAKRDYPRINWVEADLTLWQPDQPCDLIFSNAALHWIDDHEELIPRLRSLLSQTGVFAVQMPDNWSSPSHQIPATILDQPGWPEGAKAVLLRDRVASPHDYEQWLQPADLETWRTTYRHILEGEDPVWEWVAGTLLRPVLAELDGDALEDFTRSVKAGYREAYTSEPGGSTVFEFSRLFFIAVAR